MTREVVREGARRMLAEALQAEVDVSRELPLDRAPEAYRNVDSRENGWTMVVLHP
jgi:threonine dehydrogenase-like Zn-dependent dehydrogenase